MLIVILIYDQLLFRPLVAWADRFRFEQEAGDAAAAILGARRAAPLAPGRPAHPAVRVAVAALAAGALVDKKPRRSSAQPQDAARLDHASVGRHLVALAGVRARGRSCASSSQDITLADVGHALLLGLATLIRVVVLIALASVIWVPIGIWVGTRPQVANLVQPVAQFLAAFPANLAVSRSRSR